MDGMRSRPLGDEVWILEDEPGPAQLVLELCRAAEVEPRLFQTAAPLLRALRSAAPSVVVLDWRLGNELSAPLFLALRHRIPLLPVIYWTASETTALPEAIRNDRMTRAVEKSSGIAAFEDALAWALYATSGVAAAHRISGGVQPA